MKGFAFWVLVFVVGTALVLLSLSADGSSSPVPDIALTRHEVDTAFTTRSRKLKEMGHTSSPDKHDAGSVNLEDYDPIDPVPSSKTSISSGPIQHGTPLMPFIPKPSPPDHPKHSGFP
ncbi:Neuronal tyrosine-phosphorylated phosphoinositide-3-kinase [Actinidia chinensis var. chinensis]|uniref:Neuronal tyrosine-phosphorylated phosphoinositide-3-kinase n=1 Tax=Actinidia chinensis var. chinensis TaxID=1590841 RepID=A0A2R6R385_ACTCC|nr:Neuronal tyrosine-phosphorylated phosphoinositide-3-kinase [Actinidia chinensis var. chinensis]